MSASPPTSVFTVAIRRNLTAFHHLIGGDWGRENEHHSHDYLIEVALEGAALDRHGYVYDIAELEKVLEQLVARYRGSNLNELEEFRGQNPSVERFAAAISTQLVRQIPRGALSALSVTVWEHSQAWAKHRIEYA